jgi:RNA polymerase sigma-70 factor (ECF subfamily)
MAEPDDVAQMAMLRLLERRDTIPQPRAWLYKTVRTTAFDVSRRHYREKKRFANLDDPDMAGQICERADERGYVRMNNTYVAQRDESDLDLIPRLKSILQQLRPQLRQVLLLYAQGNTYQQIADLLGVNIGTIRSRLHHARRRAQESLGEV